MESPFSNSMRRFTEQIYRALIKGLQVVLRRDCAVDQREYEHVTRKLPDFKEFLIGQGPSLDGVALQRDRSPMRNFKP
jgi:hypothetical protein